MDGILIVDKKQNWTSHDVRIVRPHISAANRLGDQRESTLHKIQIFRSL